MVFVLGLDPRNRERACAGETDCFLDGQYDAASLPSMCREMIHEPSAARGYINESVPTNWGGANLFNGIYLEGRGYSEKR